MNETEKKAFEMLSEEKQNEVAGGEQIREDESLTEAQCRKLKEAVSNLSEEEQLKIAGGENASEGAKLNPKQREELEQLLAGKPIKDDLLKKPLVGAMKYGFRAPLDRPVFCKPQRNNED